MKKFALAAVVASITFGGTSGFAASFGTTTGGFGAANKVVASCGTGMTFAYTAEFDPDISGYAVDAVELSHIPAGCLNETVSMTFLGTDDNAAGPAVSVSLPASGTTERIPIPDTIDAGQVHGVSVVVS